MVVPLSQLSAGEQARVVWIASEPDTAKRLADLGFAPREPVTCVIKGPERCMSAYLIRDSVIALRAANAAEILVKLNS
ncbi:MAG: ferrous iron transport protein A [Enterocloster asparagiformis]|nr:ferrous iron transport protein A [Enterocloster asparagiformis]